VTTDDITLGVVGLGLIGGSVARGWLERTGRGVVAWTRSPATRAQAAAQGVTIASSVADVIDRSDVVILATPLAALGDTLAEAAAAGRSRSEPPTLTDVGSVKAPLHDLARRVLPDPSIFVPGHPMAGTEHAGWLSADPDLFRDRKWALVVDAPVDLRRWSAVSDVALTLGSSVVPVAATDHDRAVALVSHLPHLIAAALRSLLATEPTSLGASLVAGSFSGATRVTSGAGRALGAEMAWTNRREAVTRIDQLVAELGRQRSALESGDPQTLARLFPTDALDPGHDRPDPTSLAVTRSGLLALGRRGGLVVGHEGSGRVTVRDPGSGRDVVTAEAGA